MTLFIACLLISEFGMNDSLYAVAVAIWILHLIEHYTHDHYFFK